MKTKIYITILLLLALGFSLHAQNVAISDDNSTPDPSAMLDVKSSDKGMLIPRMTLLERTSISNPAEGLTVYQTDDVKGFYYYDGSQWTAFVNTSQITSFGSGQIITTDERALVNSAVQTEVDPVLTANITDYGSGQVITNAERTKLTNNLDSDTTNEIQDISYDGKLLSIENGSSIQIIPAGMIQPFAGPDTAVPAGWLLCDGSALNKYDNPEYSDLYNVIGNYWGGTSGADFYVPDLRGIFLRGVNGTRADTLADPDTDLRKNIAGVVVGNVVGSYQAHSLQSHNHSLSPSSANDGTGDFKMTGDGSHGLSANPTGYTGGYETRPKNAYVNYIIKY